MDCPFIRSRHSHEMIFAFGGWSGGSATSMLEAYDVRADKWTVVSSDYGLSFACFSLTHLLNSFLLKFHHVYITVV